jgi:DNA gyrase subunit A
VIRVPVKVISVLGRNTQGVRLIHLDEGDRFCDVARVVIEDEAAVDGADSVIESEAEGEGGGEDA